MKANWDDVTFNRCYIANYGWTLSHLLRSINEAFIFIDIGANQGLFSLIAARNNNCKQILAFEPVASTYSLLKENISENKANDKVLAINAAISSTEGLSTIYLPEMHSGAATLGNAGINDLNSTREEIKTVNFSTIDILLSGGCDIVVKIDVEGHEGVVLTELMKSIHMPKMSTIFYEVDEKWVTPDVLRDLLAKHGFQHFSIHGNGSHYDVLARR